jgi:hypothetical protein
VAVKAHADARAAGIRQQAADAREQLAVDRHVDVRAAQLANRLPQAGQQAAQRLVVHRVHVGRVHHLHEVEDFTVLAEQQGMQRRAGVALLELRKHLVGQHQAAHFRQQDHHDGARRLVGGRNPCGSAATASMPETAAHSGMPAQRSIQRCRLMFIKRLVAGRRGTAR